MNAKVVVRKVMTGGRVQVEFLEGEQKGTVSMRQSVNLLRVPAAVPPKEEAAKAAKSGSDMPIPLLSLPEGETRVQEIFGDALPPVL